jgi:hypothetical protein
MTRVVFFTAILFLAAHAAAQDRPLPTDGGVRAWTISYSDGRTKMSLIRSSSWLWTPEFPRIKGAVTSRNGRPLMALAYSYVADGEDLVFEISLLYGSFARDAGVLVDTVRVTPDRPVRVDKLRSFNVEPVVLSITRTRRPSLQQPAVICASGQLEVHVEPVQQDEPLYRFTVINHGRQAVRVIQIQAYNGDKMILSGRRRGDRDVPWMQSGATQTFTYAPGGKAGDDGLPMWNSWDRVEIPSVVWDDGIVEGDLVLLVSEQRRNQEIVAQIPRVLTLLKDFRSDAGLRAGLAALPPNAGAENVKTAVRSDLDRFHATHDSNDAKAMQGWLNATEASLRAWSERLSRLPYVLP